MIRESITGSIASAAAVADGKAGTLVTILAVVIIVTVPSIMEAYAKLVLALAEAKAKAEAVEAKTQVRLAAICKRSKPDPDPARIPPKQARGENRAKRRRGLKRRGSKGSPRRRNKSGTLHESHAHSPAASGCR